MVSHQPPYDTINDQVSPGVHVGSKSIRKFIEERQPLICFTGHIHEGTGIDHIGNTAIVNPGPAGKGSYVLTEILDGKIKRLEVAQPFRPDTSLFKYSVFGIRSSVVICIDLFQLISKFQCHEKTTLFCLRPASNVFLNDPLFQGWSGSGKG